MIKFNEIYYTNWKNHFEESGVCNAVRSTSMSVTFLNQFNMLLSFYYKKWNNILG